MVLAADRTLKRLFVGLGIVVVIAILAFVFLPWGVLYVAIELSDGALLLGWAALDFAKYLRDRSDQIHLRDAVLLAGFGLLTIAGLEVGVLRDAPWTLSTRQQTGIAKAVERIRGSTVTLVWIGPDDNSNRFARDLKAALERGGVRVDPLNVVQFDDGVSEGMTVALPAAINQALKDVFADVFRISGQKFIVASGKPQHPEIDILLKPH